MIWNTQEHEEKWQALKATQLVGFNIETPLLNEGEQDYGRWFLRHSRVRRWTRLTQTEEFSPCVPFVYAARQHTCCGVLEFGHFPYAGTLACFPEEYHVTLFAEVLKRALNKERTNLVVSTLVEDAQPFMYPILTTLGFVKQLDTVNPKTTNRVDLFTLRLDETNVAVPKYGYQPQEPAQGEPTWVRPTFEDLVMPDSFEDLAAEYVVGI